MQYYLSPFTHAQDSMLVGFIVKDLCLQIGISYDHSTCQRDSEFYLCTLEDRDNKPKQPDRRFNMRNSILTSLIHFAYWLMHIQFGYLVSWVV